MKVYLMLNKKIINGYSYEPIADWPEIEVEDPKEINLGVDIFEKGAIIKKPQKREVINAARIIELKRLLAESDYIALKCFDGEISEEEYAELKAKRHAWREEIRKLTK